MLKIVKTEINNKFLSKVDDFYSYYSPSIKSKGEMSSYTDFIWTYKFPFDLSFIENDVISYIQSAEEMNHYYWSCSTSGTIQRLLDYVQTCNVLSLLEISNHANLKIELPFTNDSADFDSYKFPVLGLGYILKLARLNSIFVQEIASVLIAVIKYEYEFDELPKKQASILESGLLKPIIEFYQKYYDSHSHNNNIENDITNCYYQLKDAVYKIFDDPESRERIVFHLVGASEMILPIFDPDFSDTESLVNLAYGLSSDNLITNSKYRFLHYIKNLSKFSSDFTKTPIPNWNTVFLNELNINYEDIINYFTFLNHQLIIDKKDKLLDKNEINSDNKELGATLLSTLCMQLHFFRDYCFYLESLAREGGILSNLFGEYDPELYTNLIKFSCICFMKEKNEPVICSLMESFIEEKGLKALKYFEYWRIWLQIYIGYWWIKRQVLEYDLMASQGHNEILFSCYFENTNFCSDSIDCKDCYTNVMNLSKNLGSNIFKLKHYPHPPLMH